jgi:hypothetical protein
MDTVGLVKQVMVVGPVIIAVIQGALVLLSVSLKTGQDMPP